MVRINTDSEILLILPLSLHAESKLRDSAFKELWFRKGATRRKYKTKLLRAFGGPMSPLNLVQFGPCTLRIAVTKLPPGKLAEKIRSIRTNNSALDCPIFLKFGTQMQYESSEAAK